MHCLPLPRHVIWDWNGTLLDDVALCVEVMDGMLRARGLPGLDVQRYREVFDFPVIEYYRRLGFDFEVEPFSEVGTEFIVTYERRRHEAPLRAGAVEVLHRLRAAGVTQSLLSAYRQESLEQLIRTHGLETHFLALRGLGDHYAHGKQELGLRHLAELPYAREEIVLVGDTVHDHEVATLLGLRAFLLTDGHQAASRLATSGRPLLAELRALPSVLGLECMMQTTS
ncbi:MAG: hypothetical protein A2284_02865 [Deltaproteobacteria bacterium RIFOXYA12_FULL_61_11]|nr:MAG: hypothetical protein A2284_02865 [Deltaproteobacteria bacterium RIFOXYA12_FULL_61_11]